MIRAILIDPYHGEGEDFVREVTLPDTDISHIYAALSADQHPVDCFDCVRIAHGDAIFVDDEGLLRDRMETGFFHWHGYPQILAGRGLILGCDSGGETVDCKTTLDEARSLATRIEYLRLEV